MAFVHLRCYPIRPYPNKTHRSDDLFINAAIMQLATYEIDTTIEQPSFGQSPIVFVLRAMFIILKFNIVSAIHHFRYDIPAIRSLWRHNSKVAHHYGLRKCKLPTSDTYWVIEGRSNRQDTNLYGRDTCFTTYSNNNNSLSLDLKIKITYEYTYLRSRDQTRYSVNKNRYARV